MKTYPPGTQVTFKSEHGQVLTGTVYSCNEQAIMVTTLIGVHVIAHSQVICYDKMIAVKEDTYEEWSNYNSQVFNTWYDDDDTF